MRHADPVEPSVDWTKVQRVAVRVVAVGPTVAEVLVEPQAARWEAVSIELCGGTHVANTAEAGDFALVEARAAGARAPSGLS